MDCYKCEKYFPDIPLLKCGHALCSECYCCLKFYKIHKCIICNKELIRGSKKNRTIIK